MNGIIKNQQTNSNGQLPSLHELTGLTIKTSNQSTLGTLNNCSPNSLSSNGTSPLTNQQSNLSVSTNSSSHSPSSHSPSNRNSKDSKLNLVDCKSNVLNGN